MPKPDYLHFLSILENKHPHDRPTLFAPFICDTLCEQLIWRRGTQLWDTPAHYVDTMVSLRERTQADIVILDARRFCVSSIQALLYTAEACCPDGARYVILCDKPDVQRHAEASPAVCAIGGYENTFPRTKSFIRMDKTPEYAVSEHAAGWFAPDHAREYYDAYHPSLCILGGMDGVWCAAAEPLAIHRAAIALMEHTKNCGWMLGSGGEIPENAYLSLISGLGIYTRYR